MTRPLRLRWRAMAGAALALPLLSLADNGRHQIVAAAEIAPTRPIATSAETPSNLQRLRREIADLRRQLELAQGKLEEKAPPRIELIDPELAGTRGPGIQSA